MLRSCPRESFVARLDHPALELGEQRRAPLLAHGVALGWRQAVDRAFDIEQGIDALHGFDRQWIDQVGLLAARLLARRRFDIGQLEHFAPAVGPAAGFHNRRRLTTRRIEIAITAKGIGLQNAAPAGEMRRGMFASTIAGIIEYRRRRIGAAERSVIAHIGP